MQRHVGKAWTRIGLAFRRRTASIRLTCTQRPVVMTADIWSLEVTCVMLF